MPDAERGCNGGFASVGQHIFQNRYVSDGINEGQIEARGRQLAARLRSQKLARGLHDPGHLRWSQPQGRSVEGAAFLDLDKDYLIPALQDQVYLALFSPIALHKQVVPGSKIPAQNRRFGRQSCLIIARLPQSGLSFSSASAA